MPPLSRSQIKLNAQKIILGINYQKSRNLLMFRVSSHRAGHLPIDLTVCKTGIKTKSKMFEEIFTNQGFNHITEKILINLDVKSLWRCRLVCKALHEFIKSFEISIKLKKNDFKIIQRIRWKRCLVHSSWNAVFNSIRGEDNFYTRRYLIELLKTYDNQDKNLDFEGHINSTSYLNLSKFLIIQN